MPDYDHRALADIIMGGSIINGHKSFSAKHRVDFLGIGGVCRE